MYAVYSHYCAHVIQAIFITTMNSNIHNTTMQHAFDLKSMVISYYNQPLTAFMFSSMDQSSKTTIQFNYITQEKIEKITFLNASWNLKH